MGELRMTKEMIISSTGHETMVAILEDDLVAEIFVERERQRGVVGNVYKGRVSKVLPGMQSSFIDIGLERDGFLYVADVLDTLDDFDKLDGSDDDEEATVQAGADSSQDPSFQIAADAGETAAPVAAATRLRDGGRGRDREGSRGERDQSLPK